MIPLEKQLCLLCSDHDSCKDHYIVRNPITGICYCPRTGFQMRFGLEQNLEEVTNCLTGLLNKPSK